MEVDGRVDFTTRSDFSVSYARRLLEEGNDRFLEDEDDY